MRARRGSLRAVVRVRAGFDYPVVIVRVLVSMILIAGGCRSLTPYEQAKAELPKSEFLTIEGRSVRVKQVGAGPPLLLVHGFFASTFAWRKVMPGLAKSFRVISIDLNGFGYTERPELAESYFIPGQAGLVMAVMEALHLKRAHVLGHSFGAAVVLNLAERRPDLVDRLVLVDGSHDFGSVWFLGGFHQFTYLYLRHVVSIAWARRWLRATILDDSIIDEPMAHGYWDPVMIEGLDRSFYPLAEQTSQPRPEPDWNSIAQPTLVCWGAHDTTFAPETGRRLTHNLPNATLAIFDDSGHLPHEEQPDRFVEVVRDFLSAASP